MEIKHFQGRPNKFDQFELPVSDDDFRNWVRQGQEAAGSDLQSRESS